MGSYSLTFKRSVAKNLQGILSNDLRKVLACIEALADNPRPHGCQKLSGQERYRVRQGHYRIVCESRDDILCVLVVT
jgi:mRNA interferase RelE/StbE